MVRTRFIERLLIIVALLLWPGIAGLLQAADTFGYITAGNAAYSYVDISGTGASVLSGEDDSNAVVALPFGFRFYGTLYSSLCVSTNGVAAFGNCLTDDVTNLDLTAQAPAGDLPLIAPLWMDLTFAAPGSGSVFYQTLGAAGKRQFVVQWHNAFALNLPGAFDFQVVLYEGSNNVLFQYRTVETSSAAVSKGAGATVGIRNTSGHINGNRSQSSFRAPVLTNGTAIRFTPPAGQPKLTGVVTTKGVDASGKYYVDLQLSNTGAGPASNVIVTQLQLRTLSGTGTVTLVAPNLPALVGTLDIGSSATLRVTMNRPATVTRFSITETGTLQDSAGATLTFSLAQTVIP